MTAPVKQISDAAAEGILDAIERTEDSISMAATWEGGGEATVRSAKAGIITVAVNVISTVEHSGDVQGIEDQLHRLRTQSWVVKRNRSRYLVEVTAVNIGLREGHQEEDCDYEVHATGTVTLRVSKAPKGAKTTATAVR